MRDDFQQNGAFFSFLDRWFVAVWIPIVLSLGLVLNRGNHNQYVLTTDAEGYYIYLPAFFIYHSSVSYNGTDGLHSSDCCAVEDGVVKTRYPYGVAVLETPFFLCAHLFTRLFYDGKSEPPSTWTRVPAGHAENIFKRQYTALRGYSTGWSLPYAYAIFAAALFYSTLGLVFLKSFLKRYFSITVSLLVVIVIGLGTNLLFYTTLTPGMSHVYSFFLFAAFLWQLPGFLAKPGLWNTLLISLTFGLICACRPTNAIAGILFLLFEVHSWSQFRERLLWLRKNIAPFLAMGFIFFLLALPQFFYNKSVYGAGLTYSYGNEGFQNWNSPKILSVLFSHQNGFFLYAPVMLFIIPGLIISYRKKTASWVAVLVIFVLATYIFASWWAWWFGGAYGHRCYIEFLPILGLPLAVFFQWLIEFRIKIIHIMLGLVLFFFVHANIKMSVIYTRTKPWDGPEWTFQHYKKLWGKVMSPFNFWGPKKN